MLSGARAAEQSRRPERRRPKDQKAQADEDHRKRGFEPRLPQRDRRHSQGGMNSPAHMPARRARASSSAGT
jgi:hypothetical protein